MSRTRSPRRRPSLAVLACVLAVAAGDSVGPVTDGQERTVAISSSAGVEPEPAAEPVPAPDAAFTPVRPWLRDPPTTPTTPPPDPDEPAVMPPTHTVASGETLVEVADRYGLPVDELVRANAVRNRHLLRPGRTLVLPRAEPPATADPPATPAQAVAADLPAEPLLDETAAAFGLDPYLVKAVAWRESRWNQRVVSPRGAIGVMQVRPTTGQVVAEHLGRPLDLYDLQDNITAGVAYLDMLHDRMGGDHDTMLAAYHQGARSVRDGGRLPVTDSYIAEVLVLRDRFAQLPDPR